MTDEPPTRRLSFFSRQRTRKATFQGAFFLCALVSCNFLIAEETEPPDKTFQLETFTSSTAPFSAPVAPLQPSKPINSESLFEKVILCYPSKSKFDVSVSLKARYGLQDDSVSEISDLGKYYFGIVAEMPILDGSEALDRQRKREYDRRKDTAAAVAKFVQAIAKRNQIERQIGLYTALEQRAQTRVQMGIAPVGEQVNYLEKVIGSQEKLESVKAEILQTRLELSGQCEASQMDAMNSYLKSLAETSGEVEQKEGEQ